MKTNRTQNRKIARSCGFDSLRRHHSKKDQSPQNITGNRSLRRLAINNATERKDDTMRKLLASLFLIITLGTAQGAYAGPYEDAKAAYNREDYATALSLFRLAAAQGNAKAQYALGVMYEYGRVFGHDNK